MKSTIAAIAITLALAGSAFAQNADQLEAQFTTCDKHHIPSNLCTLDIAKQLAAKDHETACSQEAIDLTIAYKRAIVYCTDGKPILTSKVKQICVDAPVWLALTPKEQHDKACNQ